MYGTAAESFINSIISTVDSTTMYTTVEFFVSSDDAAGSYELIAIAEDEDDSSLSFETVPFYLNFYKTNLSGYLCTKADETFTEFPAEGF